MKESEIYFNSEDLILNLTAKMISECLSDDDLDSFVSQFKNLPDDSKDGVRRYLEFFDHVYDEMGMSESCLLYQVVQYLDD